MKGAGCEAVSRMGVLAIESTPITVAFSFHSATASGANRGRILEKSELFKPPW
jgi:hypothetical protein